MGSSPTPNWTRRLQAQTPQDGAVSDDTDVIWVASDSTSTPPAQPSPPEENNPPTNRGIYRACNCPHYQDIYDTWPTQDASIYIAACMTICTYCGCNLKLAINLRKYMARMECRTRNLEIITGRLGKNCSTTPEWTPKEPGPGNSQPAPELPS
jgi:hypothetical protein